MACNRQSVPVYPSVIALSVLNSWKEISSYVGRAVRTIQRWEAECSFPVHRPMGRDRTGVVAFPAEINEWMEHTPIRDDTWPPEKHPVSSSLAVSAKNRGQLTTVTKSVLNKVTPPTAIIGAGNLQRTGERHAKAKLIGKLNTEVTAILICSQQALEMAGLPSCVASKLKTVYESAKKMRSHLNTGCVTF